MNLLFRLLALLMLLTAATSRAEVPLNRLLGKLDAEQYEKDVGVLAGGPYKLSRRAPEMKMADRFTPGNLAKARAFLTKRLQSMGYQNVYAAEFDMLYKTGTGLQKRGDGVNLWVEIPGSEKPNDIVTYVAHYDTTGKNRPGANDNGTGVASLLAVADALKKSRIRPKRTVRFLLTDGEERRPLYQGSEHFFESSVRAGENNVLVINVDMLGYQPSDFETAGYSAELYPKALGLLEKANRESGLNMEMTAFEPFFSDNLPPTFKGIPAIAITEDSRDVEGSLIDAYPYYHEAKDKPKEVNFAYAMKLVKWSAATLLLAANNPRQRFDNERSKLIRQADELQRKYRDNGAVHEAVEIRRHARSLCMATLKILGDPDIE